MSIKLVPNPKPNRAQAVFERRIEKHFNVKRGMMAIAACDNQRYASSHVQDLWVMFKAGDL
ncbi:hypothetical protein POR1_43 [Pseudomonas phage POR1]|uniref:Uncharacterized protein n=1 Tax=Pseudomonas phage POR1 TaxID=1718594 RepID=A0A0N9SH71_9CAUD|nr:hypothetical protein POR1_43 [Pseudomonas phage POR1]